MVLVLIDLMSPGSGVDCIGYSRCTENRANGPGDSNGIMDRYMGIRYSALAWETTT